MRNPIFSEFEKLKLISKKNLFIINKKTRDKKINVLKDKKTQIIFLEKYLTTIKYYASIKNNKKKNKKSDKIKTLTGNIKSPYFTCTG